MKLTLAFSPCPNDTFIFDALVNKKIDTQGFEFEVLLEDVQTLNEWAQQGKADVSKISYGVLPLLLDQYVVLNSGGALGKGVGPLLVEKRDKAHGTGDKEPATTKIAIPGENTTAHLLFSLAYSDVKNKVFKKFNEIEDAVLSDEADAGVIIHESRFTYEEKGLQKIMDLGEYWEQKTQCPIPLGGIVAKRSLPPDVKKKIEILIRKSMEYSFFNHPHISEYVKQHAQEMSVDVMRKHIDLYVNLYSIDLLDDGRKAVLKLLDIYQQLHPEVTFDKTKVFL